ncbi:hypothetical protein BJX65DRAFT_307737 [Aspergillus insuetus]
MAIAQKAAQCALCLEGISQAAPTEDARQEWENQIFRFNLWSANNFVFAPTRASMDWRLRNAPLLESSMCELLDDLQSSLIRCTAMMKKHTIQDAANHSIDVSDTLEELFRLSRAVRRSGILRRFVKIESYIEFDDNGINLTDEFRNGVERLIEYRLKGSPASQILQERVVNTICLRQQHFAYLRAKWEKRTAQPTAINPVPAQPRSSLGATFSVSGSISSCPRPGKPKERVPIPTVMTATTARPERLKTVRSLKSAMSAEHEDVEFSPEDLHFHRRKHIVQDIMPYFCIFDDCPTTNTLFESGRDWLKHMRDRHVVSGWTCMDQSHSTTLVFDTESVFKDHMYTSHSGEFANDELDDIAAASHQRLAPHDLVTTCPFCPTDLANTIHTDTLMSHLAEHMLSLAQISVSWKMDGESSDSQSSRAGYSLRYPIGLPSGRSRSRRPQYITIGRARQYFHMRRDSLTERLQLDFPSQDDDHNAPDEDYTPEDGFPPEGDMEFFNSLWRNVRQELQLPPLTNPLPSLKELQDQPQELFNTEPKFDADMPDVKGDVHYHGPNAIELDYDPLEVDANSNHDTPPSDRLASYQSDWGEESDGSPAPTTRRLGSDFGYLHERYGEFPAPRPRYLRRNSSLDAYDRRPSRTVDALEEHRDYHPRTIHSPPHPIQIELRRDLRDEVEVPIHPRDEYEIIRVEKQQRESNSYVPRRLEIIRAEKRQRGSNTYVPRRLVSTGAMREKGYQYREAGDGFIIEKPLSNSQLQALFNRSRELASEDWEAETGWIDTRLPYPRQTDREENDQLMWLEQRESRDEEPGEAPKQYPRKGKTRFPAKLVDTGAISELGYSYEEEGDKVIINLALSKEQIDGLVKRSRELKERTGRSRSEERDRGPSTRRRPVLLELDTPLERGSSKRAHPRNHRQTPG